MIGKYKIIALCTCRIQDGECHGLVNELDQQLRNMGCRLFVYNCISKLNTNAEINAQISVFDIIDPSFCDAPLSDEIKNKFFSTKGIASKVLPLMMNQPDAAFSGGVPYLTFE